MTSMTARETALFDTLRLVTNELKLVWRGLGQLNENQYVRYAEGIMFSPPTTTVTNELKLVWRGDSVVQFLNDAPDRVSAVTAAASATPLEIAADRLEERVRTSLADQEHAGISEASVQEKLTESDKVKRLDLSDVLREWAEALQEARTHHGPSPDLQGKESSTENLHASDLHRSYTD